MTARLPWPLAATSKPRRNLLLVEEFEETFVNEISDFLFTIALAGRTELTELFDDLIVLEVDTDECVIVAAALDDGPVHDVIGGGAERIAHVALLVDFFLTSARLAIGEDWVRLS